MRVQGGTHIWSSCSASGHPGVWRTTVGSGAFLGHPQWTITCVLQGRLITWTPGAPLVLYIYILFILFLTEASRKCPAFCFQVPAVPDIPQDPGECYTPGTVEQYLEFPPPSPLAQGLASYPVVGHRLQPILPQLVHQHLVLAQICLAAHDDDGHSLTEVRHLWVPLRGESYK